MYKHLWTRVVTRSLATLLITMTLCLSASCFGRFPLTRLVYRVNDSIGGSAPLSKLLESIVMWVFAWLPVYAIAILGDVIIFNLIEFWTGQAVDVEVSSASPDGRTVATLSPTADPNVVELTLRRDGQVISRDTFVRGENGVTNVVNADGQIAGRVIADGQQALIFTDAQARRLGTLQASDLSALAAH